MYDKQVVMIMIDLKLKVWKLKIYITIIKPYEFYYSLQKQGQ